MEEPDPDMLANAQLQQKLRQKKMKKRGVVATVFLLTILLHVIAGVIAGTIYIVHEMVEEAEDFEEPPPVAIESAPPPPPPMVTKMKAKSSPPRPRPIVVHNPNNISLPSLDVPNIDTNIAIRGRGSGGFGVGVGGGAGGPPKFDINVEFFGAKGGGENIAFILDFSGSMSQGVRSEVLRREVIRTLDSLPDGVNVSIICFSGPAWDIGDSIGELSKGWYKFQEYSEKHNEWKYSGHSVYPKTVRELSQSKWIKLTGASRRKLQEQVKYMRLLSGTVFSPGFYMALRLDPLPDTIFFMTDGSCSEERGIEAISKLWNQAKKIHGNKNMPKINAIGLDVGGTGEDAKRKLKDAQKDEKGAVGHVMRIAELGKGEAVFLTGEGYKKEYGEDDSVDWVAVQKKSDGEAGTEFIEVDRDKQKKTKYFQFDDLLAK